MPSGDDGGGSGNSISAAQHRGNTVATRDKLAKYLCTE